MMKRIFSALVSSAVMCLFVWSSVSARADWVVSALAYSSNTTTITPTGSSLGSGGFCYYTISGDTLIATALVNAASVRASEYASAGADAYWSGTGTPTAITASLTAKAQGTYESGATSASTCSSTGQASCGGQTITVTGSTSYPTSYSYPTRPTGIIVLLNPNGEDGPFFLTTIAECESYNTGSYSYAEGTGDFTYEL